MMRWLLLGVVLVGACARGGYLVPAGGDGQPPVDAVGVGERPLADGAGPVEQRPGDGQTPLPPLVPKWCKTFGSTGSDATWGVATGPGGLVYVTGHFNQTIDFGGGPLQSAGNSDIFILALTPDGAYRWAKRIGAAGADEGWALAIDPQGNLFLVAHFAGTINAGGSNLISKGDADILVASFGSDGSHRWSTSGGGPGQEWPRSLVLDQQGNLFVTGHFSGQAAIAATDLVSAGGTDIFLASYLSSGEPRWARRFGGSGNDRGRGITIDQAGNPIIIGHFEGSADLGGNFPLVSAGATDIFLASFTSAGGYRWSRAHGGSGPDYGMSAAVDPSRDLLALTGSFSSTVSFGSFSLVSAGLGDAFVATFSASSGQPASAVKEGSSEDDWGTAATFDGSGAILAGGHFRKIFGELPSQGGEDAVGCRVAPPHQPTECAALGGAGDDRATGIAVDGNGGVAIVGTHTAPLTNSLCPSLHRGGLDLFVVGLR